MIDIWQLILEFILMWRHGIPYLHFWSALLRLPTSYVEVFYWIFVGVLAAVFIVSHLVDRRRKRRK